MTSRRGTGIPERHQSNYNQKIAVPKGSTFGSQTQDGLLLQEFVSQEGGQISANRENPCTTKNDRYRLRHLYSIALDVRQLNSSPKKLSTTAQSVNATLAARGVPRSFYHKLFPLPSSLPRAVTQTIARFHNFRHVCFPSAPVL
jgi:hypothetical protein